MYRFILSLTLVFLAGCCLSLYGQSSNCCAASARISSCAKQQLDGKVLTASTTADPAAVAVQTEPNCTQAGAQAASLDTAGKTQNCDPKNCERKNCDPASCDPSKCDLSKCQAKAAGAGEASAKVADQPAASASGKAG